MAKTIFELLWDLKVDRSGIAQQLNQVRDDINWFNQRIKDQTAIQLSLNVWNIKAQLDDVKAQLKLAKEAGNRDGVVTLNADVSRLQQSLTQAGRELRNYTRTWSSDISVLWKNFQWVNHEVLKQGSIIQSTVEKMKISFVWLKEVLITAFSVTAITQFIRGMFDLTSQVQQAKIAFANLYKSEEIAIKLLNDIQLFAKQTPFDQFGLVDGAKRLSAYGFQAKQILPIMNALGNAVAGVWWSQETLNGVIIALWQMQTKWRLVQQEVNQIAERGIPIFEILREKLWLTQEQLADIGNQNISSAKAIPLILEWINEKFWWLMEQQSKTLQGRLSNIIDNFKINMSRLWEVLEPIFSWILSSLSAIVTPAFNILILGVRGFMAIFRSIFDGAKFVYQAFANNFVIITKTILASFLTALVIMRQQTIISFLQWVVNQFVRGMVVMWTSVIQFSKATLYFITNIRQLTTEAIRATLALWKKAIARTITTAKTYAQIIANNLASLSFRTLWVSILSVLKNLVLLGARFFLIASIVTAVVVAIFTNWNTLKEKLKPVFDFMAKVGQAVPHAIAKAWNFAVDVIFGAIKGILSSWKAVADFLKNTFNVDIGSDNINKYMTQIEQARNNLKTNADQVKSIFDGIADETGNAFNFIKDQILGTWLTTDQLGDDVLSLAGKFDDVGSSSEQAHKKGSRASQEAQEQLNNLKETTKQLEKANTTLEKTIEKLSDAQQNYKDTVVDSVNAIKNNLRDAQKEYDKTIKKIQETREEELKNIELQRSQSKQDNVQDFAKSQAEDFAKSKKEQEKLQIKLTQEDDSDKRLELQKQINAEIEKQIQLQKNLDDLKKEAQEDNKELIDQIIKEQLLRAQMSDEQRAFYDFKKQQEEVDRKAQENILKTTQKAVDDQKKAEEELALTLKSLETQKKIISALDNVKNITKSQVESFLSSESFAQFDDNSQKLLQKLLELKLKVSDAMKEKQSAQQDVWMLSGKLQQESASAQLDSVAKVKAEYQELLLQITTALEKSQELSKQSFAMWSTKSPTWWTTPTDTTTIEKEQREKKKWFIEWYTTYKQEQGVVEVENQLLQSQEELAIHLDTLKKIQTAQTQSIAQMQQIWRIYFSNLISTTRATVSTLMSEYSRLISQLLYIISLQQRAGGWWRGFAVWWYTWWTDRNKIAWVVHQWEYVVPKWMVDRYAPLVNNLEWIRLRWFAQGGFTSTTNRSVNINGNINVGSSFDLNQQLDYWKWKI
jgi:tape measure domain-containing protein